MSEGDTIHRLAWRLDVALGGEVVTALTAPAARSPLRLQRNRLAIAENLTVTEIEARGKHLLIGLGADLVLHSHLGMKGSWEIARDPSGLRKQLQRAWAVIETPRATAAQFGGPLLALRTHAEMRRDPRIARLGPDLLAGDIDLERAAERMAERASRQPLGEALLDQRLLAGVGNVLKSEALWLSRLDPFASVGRTGRAELIELLRSARNLMVESVDTGRRPTRVYRNAGRPCTRCGTKIRSARQGDTNRITYWCPACQTSPG